MADDLQRKNNRKRGIRTFLTPGWILTVVLVLLFTYLAFTILAPWQLGKNSKQSDFNNRLKEALEHDPVPLSDVFPENGDSKANEDDSEHEWTHVLLQGHFLPSKEVFLRNRPIESAPAYQVITPFKTDYGPTFLVNRGWLPADNNRDTTIHNLPEAPEGHIKLSGFVRLGESESERGVSKTDGLNMISSINPEQIGESQNLQLAKNYIQLDEDGVRKIDEETSSEKETPHAVPLPQLESGPYLSYGIQWIAFGIIAPILLGWFVWSEIKERRREKAEAAELSGAEPGTDTPVVLTASTADQQQSEKSSTVLEDRYGTTRRKKGFGIRKDSDEERF